MSVNCRAEIIGAALGVSGRPAVFYWRRGGSQAGFAAWSMVDAAVAKSKFESLALGFQEATPSVSSTTHEGMMRLLQERTVTMPPGILSEKAMAGLLEGGAGAEVLDRGFPWQEHDYLDGEEENARVLSGFEAAFAQQTGATPPDWNGLEVALDDPENLRASLDLSVAYIKNYELDKCEILLGRYALPACRARGLPWIAKALQDYATLRMKQNRQAEAMLLLEDLEYMLPPHPIMLHNLGLAYNSLRMHDKAMAAFEQAVALKNGEMAYDDYWNMGITLNHTKRHKDAFMQLIRALELAPSDPAVDDVTLAKLNNTIGSCLQDASEGLPKEQAATKLGLSQEAEPYFRESAQLYAGVIGKKHHLYGSAVHALSRNLVAQGRHQEAEPFLHEALWIEALKNGIHPTPCHAMLAELLDMHAAGALPQEALAKYHDLLRVMLMHLHCRGFTADGNGGVVMQAIAKVLLLSGQELARPALALLRKGLQLVEGHIEDVEDTSWIQLMIRLDIKKAEATLELPDNTAGHVALTQTEGWLLEGPWGMPEGSGAALGLCLPTTTEPMESASLQPQSNDRM